jgi:hypothetical protein
METTVNEPKGTAPPLKEKPEGPTRILVQTQTHLVPGDDYGARCFFMLNLICQHHWNRDFVFGEDRWNSYGTQFGYDNLPCYFLVDHGQSATDHDVPILWYEWTGKSLLEPLVLATLLFRLTSIIQRSYAKRPARRNTTQAERVSIYKAPKPAEAKDGAAKSRRQMQNYPK